MNTKKLIVTLREKVKDLRLVVLLTPMSENAAPPKIEPLQKWSEKPESARYPTFDQRPSFELRLPTTRPSRNPEMRP